MPPSILHLIIMDTATILRNARRTLNDIEEEDHFLSAFGEEVVGKAQGRLSEYIDALERYDTQFKKITLLL